MDTQTHSALAGCVSSLRTSMNLLDSSISILDSGVNDFTRLAKVLQTTTHFELISEHDLTNAQSSLLSEIQPEVTNLLARVEAYLDRLGRREQSLLARAELLEGRLSREAGRKSPSRKGGDKVMPGGGGGLDEMRLQQLRLKKERLSFAVGRLELQANQKQRELRKSMAMPMRDD